MSNLKADHRIDIDCLRGIAVLVVCLFHFWPNGLTGGYIGVDIFFVISGYLITNIISKKMKEKRFSFSDFYIRRVRRLFPSLLTVLILTLGVAYFVILFTDFADLIKHSFFASIFSSNLLLWRDINYFNSTAELKPLLHLWSLGIEEQFYFVWPLLLLILLRFRHYILISYLFLLVSVVLNIYVTRHSQNAAFYLPVTRYWEFLLGGMVALHLNRFIPLFSVLARKILFGIGILMIMYSCWFFNKNTSFPGYAAILPSLGSAIVILFGSGVSVYRLTGTQPVLIFLGKISYCLYLVHWPLICLNNLAFNVSYFSPLSLFIFSILLSYLITTFIERPFLTRYANMGGFKVLMVCYIVFAASIAYLYFGKPLSAQSRKIDTDNGAYVSFLNRYDHYSDSVDVEFSEGCNFRNKDQTAKKAICDSCVVIADSARPTIFLWGDSHMQALSYGIKTRFRNTYNILQVATYSSAPTLNIRLDEVGMKSNKFALESIKRVVPEIVILAQREEHLRNDWALIAAELKKSGVKRILLIGPTPKWYPSLPRVLIKEGNINAEVLSSASGYDKAASADNEKLKEICLKNNIEYISIIDFVKRDKNTLVRIPVSHELLVFDYGHLTLPASVWIADQLISKSVK